MSGNDCCSPAAVPLRSRPLGRRSDRARRTPWRARSGSACPSSALDRSLRPPETSRWWRPAPDRWTPWRARVPIRSRRPRSRTWWSATASDERRPPPGLLNHTDTQPSLTLSRTAVGMAGFDRKKIVENRADNKMKYRLEILERAVYIAELRTFEMIYYIFWGKNPDF